eukprot:gnl/MRDRNA2_/MRDRNA2_107823_c0_seq1.p1 gnl/MRDRNA2_/MRDRNA2_107823_c0~~gnl/MRDRNA2_/MRDRNA2_107823_c0_seq1.p1  ORF type:complete len:173 (-),score=26.16 gnl/MRDRNA2_/MRDRNA2_107823_c0_seq1:329-847(-)
MGSLQLFVVSLAALGAHACECSRYQCISNKDQANEKKFTYAVSEMLSEEALACINATEAYEVDGSCKYCASCDEDDSICLCQSNNDCDVAGAMAAIACFVAAVPFFVFAMRTFLRVWYVRTQVPSYKVQEYKEENNIEAWEQRWQISIALPLLCGIAATMMGFFLWHVRATF